MAHHIFCILLTVFHHCFVAQTERYRLRALAALRHQQRRFPQQAAKGRVAAERILVVEE